MNLHDVFSATKVGEDTLQRLRLGELALSGTIGAADPLTTDRVAPFAQKVPVGTFPVEVLLFQSGDDQRVAFARVVFANEAPVRFALAGEYGVDAGTGCFADPDATLDGEELLEALEKTSVPTWSWAVAPGVVAFSSGYGDGGYDSFFGLDAEGNAVCLVTDFQVFAVDQPMELGAPEATPRASAPTKASAALPAEVAQFEAMLEEGRRPEVARVVMLGDSVALRAAAALALRSGTVLRELADEATLAPALRFECVARIEDPSVRCRLFTKLAGVDRAEAERRLTAMLSHPLADQVAIRAALSTL